MSEKLFEKLAEVQRKLAKRVVERPLDLSAVKTVGAVDVSYRGGIRKGRLRPLFFSGL